MSLRKKFSLKTKRLLSKVDTLKQKLKISLRFNPGNKSPNQKPQVAKEEEEENITSKDENIENDSNIFESKDFLSLPNISSKKVSSDASETSQATNMRKAINDLPDGSRLLSINLMGGKITEKVYLTPNGQRISFQENEL